jgi:hypothetical protein
MNDDSNRERTRGYSVLKCKTEVSTPPPPGFVSPFNSLAEWLVYLCDNNQPQSPIAEYRFNLYESPGDNLLALTGYNHIVESGVPFSKIDFTPNQHHFFSLPKDAYGRLACEESYRRMFLNTLKNRCLTPQQRLDYFWYISGKRSSLLCNSLYTAFPGLFDHPVCSH